MVKIYTRRGDGGMTSLLGGARVDKNAPTIELLGALDEAQAALGVARAECREPRDRTGVATDASPQLNEVADLIEAIERDLWTVMGEVARGPAESSSPAPQPTSLDEAMVSRLEDEIDRLGAGVDLAHAFAVPGENRLSAAIDLARTIVRRAERIAVTTVPDRALTLAYLNRLSDLCWMLARSVETERRTNHRHAATTRRGES
jgi:cob(I)alamin adenosyltransferase